MQPIPSFRALLACIVLALLPAAAIGAPEEGVERQEAGNRLTENIPEIPDALAERLQRYQNTRSASSAGWTAGGGGQYVLTRFGSTAQVHHVARPGAMREQLTFFEEPVAAALPNPVRSGFAYGRDVGGSEFWQLFWYDGASGESVLLTDGRSRNERPVWDRAGERLAFSTTQRNNRDTDIHVVGLDGTPSRPVLEREGSWYAADFSPDGKRLLVMQYVSINDTRPHLLTLDSGELEPLHDPSRPVAYGGLAFADGGRGIVYTSDEGGEFRQLHFRELDSGRTRALSGDIPWDVESFVVSRDGREAVFVSNEDGWSVAHRIALPSGRALPMPTLPRGIARPVAYSADGREIAFSLASSTMPGDAYSVRPGDGTVVRWTRSETGGLDAGRFVEPELVRFPTFDRVDGERRSIPAFYFRPSAGAGEGPYPVVIQIHGGPESQARPGFNPATQFLLNELGVAVLVPNVRGSAGYGRSYLLLDNAEKREDSVRDIGALLDWVADQPELDGERVGVYGGSYGGYMVLASMAHYSDRLRAGIDVVGISNFVTFLENTQDYRRHLRRAEYGDERDPAMRKLLERISPTTRAADITKPLFVAQGANDPRVPASESRQIVDTVRENGTDVWYLLFKDEGHGFRKKPNRDYFTAAQMLFWQTHLLDARAD